MAGLGPETGESSAVTQSASESTPSFTSKASSSSTQNASVRTPVFSSTAPSSTKTQEPVKTEKEPGDMEVPKIKKPRTGFTWRHAAMVQVALLATLGTGIGATVGLWRLRKSYREGIALPTSQSLQGGSPGGSHGLPEIAAPRVTPAPPAIPPNKLLQNRRPTAPVGQKLVRFRGSPVKAIENKPHTSTSASNNRSSPRVYRGQSVREPQALKPRVETSSTPRGGDGPAPKKNAGATPEQNPDPTPKTDPSPTLKTDPAPTLKPDPGSTPEQDPNSTPKKDSGAPPGPAPRPAAKDDSNPAPSVAPTQSYSSNGGSAGETPVGSRLASSSGRSASAASASSHTNWAYTLSQTYVPHLVRFDGTSKVTLTDKPYVPTIPVEERRVHLSEYKGKYWVPDYSLNKVVLTPQFPIPQQRPDNDPTEKDVPLLLRDILELHMAKGESTRENGEFDVREFLERYGPYATYLFLGETQALLKELLDSKFATRCSGQEGWCMGYSFNANLYGDTSESRKKMIANTDDLIKHADALKDAQQDEDIVAQHREDWNRWYSGRGVNRYPDWSCAGKLYSRYQDNVTVFAAAGQIELEAGIGSVAKTRWGEGAINGDTRVNFVVHTNTNHYQPGYIRDNLHLRMTVKDLFYTLEDFRDNLDAADVRASIDVRKPQPPPQYPTAGRFYDYLAKYGGRHVNLPPKIIEEKSPEKTEIGETAPAKTEIVETAPANPEIVETASATAEKDKTASAEIDETASTTAEIDVDKSSTVAEKAEPLSENAEEKHRASTEETESVSKTA
eukprot:GHVT01086821.1.p1 GENE.GHVT01086821.1~~GHVT01086821.1.p1  ORF type:complete len:787 (-),score=102.72 GHVT01086821.1:273-2633(-)